MSYDSYWVLGIAVTFIVLGIMIIRARQRRNYYSYNQYDYNYGYQQQFQPARPIPRQDDMFSWEQSQTDFNFYERRFKNEVDNLLRKCEEAERERDFNEALRLAYLAEEKINTCLGRDHWYAIKVLTKLGYLHYHEGNLVEARDIWQCVIEIASEWPDRCRDDVCYVNLELGKCIDRLGF